MNAKLKENVYTCGTCKYWDCDERYCQARGEREVYELDTCDGWTDPDEPVLTEQEQADIIGDRKAHEIMETEGHIE